MKKKTNIKRKKRIKKNIKKSCFFLCFKKEKSRPDIKWIKKERKLKQRNKGKEQNKIYELFFFFFISRWCYEFREVIFNQVIY
jgi:hypothetical protein